MLVLIPEAKVVETTSVPICLPTKNPSVQADCYDPVFSDTKGDDVHIG